MKGVLNLKVMSKVVSESFKETKETYKKKVEEERWKEYYRLVEEKDVVGNEKIEIEAEMEELMGIMDKIERANEDEVEVEIGDVVVSVYKETILTQYEIELNDLEKKKEEKGRKFWKLINELKKFEEEKEKEEKETDKHWAEKGMVIPTKDNVFDLIIEEIGEAMGDLESMTDHSFENGGDEFVFKHGNGYAEVFFSGVIITFNKNDNYVRIVDTRADDVLYVAEGEGSDLDMINWSEDKEEYREDIYDMFKHLRSMYAEKMGQ